MGAKEDFNYYKKALEVLSEERNWGECYAENIIAMALELAGEKDVNGWFHYGKPREGGDLDDVLHQWQYNMHKGLRQIDMFEKGRGRLDSILWNVIYLSERWPAILKKIVLPALTVESKVVVPDQPGKE